MIRVMIVDDEILVRVGIKSILDWERYGYSVVCEAGSYREAITRIGAYKPQIIFTDLMMDGMDGFDLIEYCAREHPNIKLVVLSSYNEFNYVRRAMKLGASDYIFKLTVKQDELLKVLDELRQSINAPQPDSIILRNISAIKTRLITTGIQQTYTSQAEYISEMRSLGLAVDFTQPYAVLYISIDGFAGKQRQGDFDQLQLLKTAMENITREVLSAHRRTEVFNYTAGDLLAVLLFDEPGPSAELGEDFNTIVEFMRRYLGISVSGGVSDVFTGLAALPDAAAQAVGALSARFYAKQGLLHLFGKPHKDPGDARQPPAAEKLVDALSMGDYRQTESYISELADCLHTWVGTPPERVRMRLLEAYSVFVRHAESLA